MEQEFIVDVGEYKRRRSLFIFVSHAKRNENGRRSSAFNSISLWGSVRFEGDETGRENDPNLLQLLPCVCWNFLSVIAKRYEFFSSDFHQMSDS